MLIVIIGHVIRWISPPTHSQWQRPEVTSGLSRSPVGYWGVQKPHIAPLWTRTKRAAGHKEVPPEGSSLLQLRANDWLDVLPTKAALTDLGISAGQCWTSCADHQHTQVATLVFNATGQTRVVTPTSPIKLFKRNSGVIQPAFKGGVWLCGATQEEKLLKIFVFGFSQFLHFIWDWYEKETKNYTAVLSSFWLENWMVWQRWAAIEKEQSPYRCCTTCSRHREAEQLSELSVSVMSISKRSLMQRSNFLLHSRSDKNIDPLRW